MNSIRPISVISFASKINKDTEVSLLFGKSAASIIPSSSPGLDFVESGTKIGSDALELSSAFQHIFSPVTTLTLEIYKVQGIYENIVQVKLASCLVCFKNRIKARLYYNVHSKLIGFSRVSLFQSIKVLIVFPIVFIIYAGKLQHVVCEMLRGNVNYRFLFFTKRGSCGSGSFHQVFTRFRRLGPNSNTLMLVR